jgi:hypothetical protein
MRKFCFLVCFIISAWSVNAQNNYWSKHLSAGAITKGKAANRLSFPKSFQLFDLDPAPLQLPKPPLLFCLRQMAISKLLKW